MCPLFDWMRLGSLLRERISSGSKDVQIRMSVIFFGLRLSSFHGGIMLSKASGPIQAVDGGTALHRECMSPCCFKGWCLQTELDPLHLDLYKTTLPKYS